jgi:hypothetical protein
MSSSIYPRYFVRKPNSNTLEEFEIPEMVQPGQSYPLFAALNGTRNGFGITPIAPPRLLPEELRIPGDAFMGFANYLTLDEMLAYDWLSPAWRRLRPSIGESVPLHQYTRHFREQTLFALQQRQVRGEVYMVFAID